MKWEAGGWLWMLFVYNTPKWCQQFPAGAHCSTDTDREREREHRRQQKE